MGGAEAAATERTATLGGAPVDKEEDRGASREAETPDDAI